MNNTVIIGLIAFAAILAGAFAGAELIERLPKHHLTDETKNLVSVSTAVVATVSALVLGLLISNANTSFTRLGGQVTALSAEILRLDHILRRYGADAEPARNVLLQYAQHKSADLFPDDRADVRISNPSSYELLQRLEDMLLALKPQIRGINGGWLRLWPLRPRSERPDGFSRSRLGRERRKRSSLSSSFG